MQTQKMVSIWHGRWHTGHLPRFWHLCLQLPVVLVSAGKATSKTVKSLIMQTPFD